MKSQFRVIISGAGLGGLVLAHGLVRRGIDAEVFERDVLPETRHQGYRIQLDQPGLTSLQHCAPTSLVDLCLDTAGAPPPRVAVLNWQLEVIAEKTASASATAQPRSFDRGIGRRILIAGLGDRVHFGAGMQSYRLTDAGTVEVALANGQRATADVLVGADGIRSTVRAQLLPQADIRDAGIRLIYGKIDLDADTREQLPPWVFESIFTVITGRPGKPHVSVGPVEPGVPADVAGSRHVPPIGLPRTPGYLACMVGAPSDHPLLPSDDGLRTMLPAALHATATKLLSSAEWHSDVLGLIAGWHTPSLIPLRVSTAESIARIPAGPVTLMGDAIHPMSPVLAMGANTALRDAAELTDQLALAALVCWKSPRRRRRLRKVRDGCGT